MKSETNIIALVAVVIALFSLAYGFIKVGPVGPEGPQGPEGPLGPMGPPGPQGPQGESYDDIEINTIVEDKINQSLSDRLQIDIKENVDPLRGCPSCHILLDPETGLYTLAYEAHERVKARRSVDSHPNTAPDGTDLSPQSTASVDKCLLCHSSDPDTGRGIGAPLSLRDIVHPAHMASQYFKLHYSGNCFSCHNVNANGEFEILTMHVTTNEKGVPDPTQIPIPGAIAPE